MIDPGTRDKIIAAAILYGMPGERARVAQQFLDESQWDAFMGLVGLYMPQKQCLELCVQASGATSLDVVLMMVAKYDLMCDYRRVGEDAKSIGNSTMFGNPIP